MAGYDPDAGRRRLLEERAMVAANLAATRLQVARMDRPATRLLTEAIEAARLRLDQIDQELATRS